MPGSPRRVLLQRIEREIELKRAIPELDGPVAARAVVALEGERSGPIEGRLRPDRWEDASDRRVHAIAALEGARFAQAIATGDAGAIEASAAALVRAWAALGRRRAYVEGLARRVLGTDAPRAADVASRIGVDRVTSALLARARGEADIGGLLRALARGADGDEALAPIVARVRLEALDAVLDPLRRTLDELATRRPGTDEVVAGFAAVHAAWRRADRDVEVEILAVERVADFAWDLYRERRLVELGRLIEEVAEPAMSMATRIEGGDALAWAAPCAQVLVFRAELAPRFDAQIAFAERAYAVCPSLRNARIVLGDFLLTRAERALDRGADRTSAGTTPETDVERAASIHPELKRLAAVRDKLKRAAKSAR